MAKKVKVIGNNPFTDIELIRIHTALVDNCDHYQKMDEFDDDAPEDQLELDLIIEDIVNLHSIIKKIEGLTNIPSPYNHQATPLLRKMEDMRSQLPEDVEDDEEEEENEDPEG